MVKHKQREMGNLKQLLNSMKNLNNYKIILKYFCLNLSKILVTKQLQYLPYYKIFKLSTYGEWIYY